MTLGLTSQLELDALVRKAADKKTKDDARRGVEEPDGASLRPASDAVDEREEVAEDAED